MPNITSSIPDSSKPVETDLFKEFPPYVMVPVTNDNHCFENWARTSGLSYIKLISCSICKKYKICEWRYIKEIWGKCDALGKYTMPIHIKLLLLLV